MIKGSKRYRQGPDLTIQELTYMGRSDKGFVWHDQEGEEIILHKQAVDQLMISKVILATELEEKIRVRLRQVQDYLRRHKEKFNPLDKPAVVYTVPNIREVHQYEMNGKYIQSFPSIKEAALAIGANPLHSNIHKACKDNPRYYSYKGFRWHYDKKIRL